MRKEEKMTNNNLESVYFDILNTEYNGKKYGSSLTRIILPLR